MACAVHILDVISSPDERRLDPVLCPAIAGDPHFAKMIATNRQLFARLPNKRQCGRNLDLLRQIIEMQAINECGIPRDDAVATEAELFGRCNLDQDFSNSLFTHARSGVPRPELLEGCSELVQFGLITHFMVRQENTHFLRLHGMPERLEPKWIETKALARALYLVTLHADHDREFQRGMVEKLRPFAGGVLPRAFFDNLAARAAAGD